jgi:hypothetical protein
VVDVGAVLRDIATRLEARSTLTYRLAAGDTWTRARDATPTGSGSRHLEFWLEVPTLSWRPAQRGHRGWDFRIRLTFASRLAHSSDYTHLGAAMMAAQDVIDVVDDTILAQRHDDQPWDITVLRTTPEYLIVQVEGPLLAIEG